MIVTDEELTERALLERLYAVPSADRMFAEWVMTRETFNRIAEVNPDRLPAYLALRIESGQRALLLGQPVRLDPAADGLEIRTSPKRSGQFVHEGETAIYRTCIDSTCPDRRPGYEHAHLTVERDVR